MPWLLLSLFSFSHSHSLFQSFFLYGRNATLWLIANLLNNTTYITPSGEMLPSSQSCEVIMIKSVANFGLQDVSSVYTCWTLCHGQVCRSDLCVSGRVGVHCLDVLQFVSLECSLYCCRRKQIVRLIAFITPCIFQGRSTKKECKCSPRAISFKKKKNPFSPTPSLLDLSS